MLEAAKSAIHDVDEVAGGVAEEEPAKPLGLLDRSIDHNRPRDADRRPGGVQIIHAHRDHRQFGAADAFRGGVQLGPELRLR